MRGSSQDEVGVDFIGDDDQLALNRNLGEPPQLLEVEGAPGRVVWVT